MRNRLMRAPWILPLLLLVTLGRVAGQGGPPEGSGEGSCMESGCHADLAERKTVHGAVEGEMCDSCHEYTGEGHAFRIAAEPIGEICVACHEDPREAGAHVHPPVMEGECTICHDPHGSEAESLLVAPSEEVCALCHEVPVPGDPPEDVVHPPAAEGMCITCHNPHSSDNPKLAREAGKDLCLICHDQIAEEVALPHVHGVIDALGCTVCHDPHGPRGTALLRESGIDLCLTCHRRESVPAAAASDGPIDIFGVREVDPEVRRAWPAIFLRGVRGHPSARHPVQAAASPLDPNKPFWCASCHRPHGSDSRKLLIGKPGFTLCGKCHQK